MKAKEKAEELFAKYVFLTISDMSDENFEETRQCALIAVDEILDIAYWEYMESMGEKEKEYWEEVKQEIINL
jgi:hypothetical protein